MLGKKYMTKKEQLRMNNLIAENVRLKDELNKQFRVYGDSLTEKVCLQARIETMREVMAWEIGEEYANDKRANREAAR